jgi:gliding motility-associated protein GldM
MYLVLTALLALNVSVPVLQKFAIVDKTLVEFVDENKGKNEAKLASILDVASDKPIVKEAQQKAQEVRKLTDATIKVLDEVKTKMKLDGEEPLEGEELVLNNNLADDLMNESNKDKVGQMYEKTLRDFVGQLKTITGVEFEPLTKREEDYDDLFLSKKQQEEKKGKPKGSIENEKTFLNFSFVGVPTMAAIASVSQMQTEILEYESKALDALNEKAGSVQIKSDVNVAMIRAESNTVLATTDYVADLFIASASSKITPEMFLNGSPVNVMADPKTGIKMGKIKIKASPDGGQYDANGIGEKKFKAKIKVSDSYELDEAVFSFKVQRPSPKFESLISSTIYLECGNEKSLTVPGLSDISDVRLTCPADEGTITPLPGGKFVFLPIKTKMNVSISLGGVPIGKEVFTTKPVPPPSPQVLYNGQLPPDKGIPASGRVKIELNVDEQFKQTNKADALYRVLKMTIDTPNGTRQVTGDQFSLSDIGARAGDRCVIRTMEVVRSTYDPTDKNDKPVNFKFGGLPITVAR